jgi:hypothetical protein
MKINRNEHKVREVYQEEESETFVNFVQFS